MPVISVKHENNKPGYTCFHIGERRDKRWSCRSSSGGRENPVQFSIDEDAATTPRDGDRRQLGARRGHKTTTDCGFIVPTPNAASPFRQPRRLCRLLPPCPLTARRLDSTKRGRGHASSRAGSGGRNFSSAAATVCCPNAVLYQWRSVLGGAHGPDSQNILRQSYDYLTIMPKLRPTYDGRPIYQTSHNEWKAFHR